MIDIIFRRALAPFVLFSGFVIVALSGCQSSDQALAAADVRLPVEEPVAISEPTLAPPPTLPAVSVYVLTEGEGGYPDPASGAPQVDDSGEPLRPTAVPTVPPPTPLPSSTPIPAATATPQPTFTPPALPQTANEDHYWLRRPVGEGGVVWTDKFYPYGGTRGGTLRVHNGVEFNVLYDTPILAAADGTVIVAGSDATELYGPEPNFYGNLVVIQHDFSINGEPIYTLYGHLNGVSVAVGQRVRTLDQIGVSGATGVADGPHMHFEVRVGQNSYTHSRNPLLWLWPFPDRGTLAGRVTFPSGEPAYNAQVTIRRIDGGESTVLSTGTYSDESVNSDPLWNENFVFDDVPAGYYEVYVKVGKKKYPAEVWVFERRTAFVEIVLGD